MYSGTFANAIDFIVLKVKFLSNVRYLVVKNKNKSILRSSF